MATQDAVEPKAVAVPRRGYLPRTKSSRALFGKIIAYTLLTIGSILIMIPVFWMVSSALKPNNQKFFVNAPGFKVQDVKIDPDNYLISANNTVIKSSSIAAGITALKITVNPNPVTSTAVVNLENMQGKTQLRVYNNAGNMLWSKLVENKASTQIQIPFSSFIHGTYRLLVTEESGAQQSVTIVK